ncbi:MAG: hypothetical protein WD069_20000, partial [Planctomycetales bacterium]
TRCWGIPHAFNRLRGEPKFWSFRGGEALLQLRADQLCGIRPLTLYWARRPHHATGTRTYNRAA